MWELLDDTLAEHAEMGLEIGNFGVEFGSISSCFVNSFEEENFCEGLGSNWGSKEADSSGNFGRSVVLVNGEGADGFLN